jgi:hypothetical protein
MEIAERIDAVRRQGESLADAARAGVTVAGDPGLLSPWQASVRVRWS